MSADYYQVQQARFKVASVIEGQNEKGLVVTQR